MIATFWPLAGVLLDRPPPGIAGRAASRWRVFAAMIAASFVAVGQQYNPARLDLPAAFLVAAEPRTPGR